MVTKLNSYGIYKDKTISATFCRQLPEENVFHYIRGILDGDGYITYKNRTKQWSVGFTGTKALLIGIRDVFVPYVRIKNKAVQSRKNSKGYRISYDGSQVSKEIIFLLYNYANVYLDRKKLLADQVLSTDTSFFMYNDFSWIDSQDLETLYDKCGSWNKVALELDIEPQYLRKLRKRLGMPIQRVYSFQRNYSPQEINHIYFMTNSWIGTAKHFNISQRHLYRIRKRLGMV